MLYARKRRNWRTKTELDLFESTPSHSFRKLELDETLVLAVTSLTDYCRKRRRLSTSCKLETGGEQEEGTGRIE